MPLQHDLVPRSSIRCALFFFPLYLLGPPTYLQRDFQTSDQAKCWSNPASRDFHLSLAIYGRMLRPSIGSSMVSQPSRLPLAWPNKSADTVFVLLYCSRSQKLRESCPRKSGRTKNACWTKIFARLLKAIVKAPLKLCLEPKALEAAISVQRPSSWWSLSKRFPTIPDARMEENANRTSHIGKWNVFLLRMCFGNHFITSVCNITHQILWTTCMWTME